MKKVPGTLYHFGLSISKTEKIEINIWYKNELVFEKTGLLDSEILGTIQSFFESKNLFIPNNRLAWKTFVLDKHGYGNPVITPRLRRLLERYYYGKNY